MALKLTDLGRRLFGGEARQPKNTRGMVRGELDTMSTKQRTRRKVRGKLQAAARRRNRRQRRGQNRK